MGEWIGKHWFYDEKDIKDILEFGSTTSCRDEEEAKFERWDVDVAMKALRLGMNWEDVNYTQIVEYLNGGK